MNDILKKLMDFASATKAPIDNGGLEEDRNVTIQLYYMHVGAATDAAHQRMEHVPEGDGLATQRADCHDHEPSVAARYVEVRPRIMQYEFGYVQGVVDAFELFDKDVRLHEQRSNDQKPAANLSAIFHKARPESHEQTPHHERGAWLGLHGEEERYRYQRFLLFGSCGSRADVH